MTENPSENSQDVNRIIRAHLAWGWLMVVVFVVLGLVLDYFHAFKVGYYMDANNATRRLLWTLAHAHGVLVGVIHLVFGWSVERLSAWGEFQRHVASRALLGASVLLPGGFFFGGLYIYDGDPGLLVFLVPVGALCLLLTAGLTARAAWVNR